MSERFRSPYPDYDVLSKWRSTSWNDQTRAVVSERLDSVPEPTFLTEDEFALLEAICARLIPQPDRTPPVPIAPFIDRKLAENRGDGYRFADMPPMREAWRRGLAAIDEESRERLARPFVSLSGRDQDRLLKAIQAGSSKGDHWQGLSPRRFFKLMLREAASIYYAHPSGWSEIGFGGPASPRGYVRLGFNERDPWEAKAE